jgi:nucleotide-binding universal stress UspA family protein
MPRFTPQFWPEVVMPALTRILCSVDFSDTSRRAVQYAVSLARWHDARLSILHVFAAVPAAGAMSGAGATGLPPALTLQHVDRDALLAQLRAFVGAAVPECSPELLLQEAPDVRAEILAEAGAFHVDLIVMGSHGRSGLPRLLLGSVADAVLRQAPCPVLVVSPHASEPTDVPFKRIICPVDFSPASRCAVNYALTLAQEGDAEITLAHSIDLAPELREYAMWARIDVDAIRAVALQRLRDLVPESARDCCTVRTELAEGRPHRDVLRLASERHADVIVMGAHGRGAVDRLVFGSNTYAVIRDAVCPVLTVPVIPQRAGSSRGQVELPQLGRP